MGKSETDNLCGTACVLPDPQKPKDGSKKREERQERGPVEKTAFYLAWIFLFGSIAYALSYPLKEGEKLPFLASAARAGANELLTFLSQHLISAMIPAFFLAAAISTFFSRETIIKSMGRNTNPLISYSLAAIAGAILTVCSCGILPIFMSILWSGAGIGPAFTFLYSSPAINPISLIYTWKIIPFMFVPRILAVIVSSIGIGLLMSKFFVEEQIEDEGETASKKSSRTPVQEWCFFLLLLLIMLTSTDALSSITGSFFPASFFGLPSSDLAIQNARLTGKMMSLFAEVIFLIFLLRQWFTWDETRKWLKRTWRQASDILPMVFLGIFYSGLLGGAPSMVEYLTTLSQNTFLSNLLASFIGAMLYFGSIVGVNIVDLFIRWGMHKGPALALLLSGPAVSLPSVLALIPIVGKKKALAFLILVIIFSMLCGLIFGIFIEQSSSLSIPGR